MGCNNSFWKVECNLIYQNFQAHVCSDGKITYFRLFGWAICSERSSETENVIIGATLEIQRMQREEILEQQIMRQQVS